MRHVLDSSVAVKCVLTEVDSDKAIGLRDDARAATHALLAPDVFPVEAGHALTSPKISDGRSPVRRKITQRQRT